MDARAETYFQKIQEAVANEKMVLPTLPEVALRIRHNIEHEDCSAKDIADLLYQDGSLAAHFIRIANSPIYRGYEKMNDLQTIISRIGLRTVKELVVSLSIKQIFTATSDSLDKQFREAWSVSTGVAAISSTLTSTVPGLSPEQGLLAGLIHNIGTLPILTVAEQSDDNFEDEAELNQLIYTLQPHVGKFILETWKFPPHLLDVVTQCYDFKRPAQGSADYTDIVQVSLLQGGYINGAANIDDYSDVAAFKKLDLNPEVNFVELEDNQEKIKETQNMLLN